MSEDIELGCRCGEIHGWAKGAEPKAAYRVVCYCDDCQAFLHHLGRAELLDEHGGTDVVQVPPRMIAYDRGFNHIVAMRLTEKGMYRWYADCCKTPLGNTLSPAVPFIGMPLEVFRGSDACRLDEVFGKVRGRALGKWAIGGPPAGSAGFPFRMIIHAFAKVLGWKLSGKSWPHPYFDQDSRQPRYSVTVLRPSEREALRAKCGPDPVERE